MGGYNSGRWHNHISKTLVEQLPFIDIRVWKKQKRLLPDNQFIWALFDNQETLQANIRVAVYGSYIDLNYTLWENGVAQSTQSLLVALGWSAGLNSRWHTWFRCPYCDNRFAKLYLKNGKFACRNCHYLGYQSQRQGLD